MVLNVPNILTIFRILLVPVFLLLVLENQLFYATIVFAIAGITDGIDGFIARTYNQRTEFGAHMDPFADKLLLVTAYLSLTLKGFLPIWLCVPVIVRDAVILTGFFTLKGAGKKVIISPSFFGKLTTALQITTVIYAMLIPFNFGLDWLTLVTAVVTVYSGLDYVWREFKIQTGREA
ncbi:MAG: CDP-diacylglycerol--glycerol-3-phosphate 3-phosphatidyltransferase [Deltaproteobacteria bacterium]|nr:CDP-diacylglycerol--glycerol-3-phosphate 3-phosphatidyltransferase [Deltaproteobacteria bacterium]